MKKKTSSVTIEGTEVRSLSPEGVQASMPLEEFFQRAGGRPLDFRSSIYPHGLRMNASRGAIEIWIHEIPPRLHCFQWIAKDSPAPYGKEAKYRTVRIALPFLVTFAVFVPGENGTLTLSGANECFFRNATIGDWSDGLCYPALLNCSRFEPQEGKPLSWICTQYLDRSFDAEPDVPRRLRNGFTALMRCLLDTKFNYSSEHHEASSWFTESRAVDPRIATVEDWEKASLRDPLFALDVPWLNTGLSLQQIAERIFSIQQAAAPGSLSAESLAQIVFNYRKPKPKSKKPSQGAFGPPPEIALFSDPLLL